VKKSRAFANCGTKGGWLQWDERLSAETAIATDGLGQRVETSERRLSPPPMFIVSVAYKGLRVSVSRLESTHIRVLASVVSKGLKCWALRLKTGKTRCLAASTHSKGLRSERAEITAEEQASALRLRAG